VRGEVADTVALGRVFPPSTSVSPVGTIYHLAPYTTGRHHIPLGTIYHWSAPYTTGRHHIPLVGTIYHRSITTHSSVTCKIIATDNVVIEYNLCLCIYLPDDDLVEVETCIRSVFFNPITGLDRLLGFQEVEAPRFLNNRHMKVVRLSALRTGRLYPPRKVKYNY
jgi:hypothetical protein